MSSENEISAATAMMRIAAALVEAGCEDHLDGKYYSNAKTAAVVCMMVRAIADEQDKEHSDEQ